EGIDGDLWPLIFHHAHLVADPVAVATFIILKRNFVLIGLDKAFGKRKAMIVSRLKVVNPIFGGKGYACFLGMGGEQVPSYSGSFRHLKVTCVSQHVIFPLGIRRVVQSNFKTR